MLVPPFYFIINENDYLGVETILISVSTEQADLSILASILPEMVLILTRF